MKCVIPYMVKLLMRILFLATVIIIGWWISSKVERKTRYQTMLNTFLSEPCDSYDVIALGSSHLYCSFNPNELYRKYKIRSFALATREQPPAISYGYLKMAMERHHPSVVLLETFMFAGSGGSAPVGDGVTHDSLDPVPLGFEKIGMIKSVKHEGALEDYLFPFIKYHSRWKELQRKDFVGFDALERDFCRGYKAFTETSKVTIKPVRLMDYPKVPLLNQDAVWLERIRELVMAHGARLVLLTAPYNSPALGHGRHRFLDEYAKKHGLLNINMNVLYDVVGFDGNRDFFDQGHLNVFGADKATEYIGRRLVEMCTHRDDAINEDKEPIWRDDLEAYDRHKAYMLGKGKGKAD